MRKRLMTMLLLTTMVMTTLAGCGDKKKDAANEGTDATAEVAESTKSDVEYMEDTISMFSFSTLNDLADLTEEERAQYNVSDHDFELASKDADGVEIYVMDTVGYLDTTMDLKGIRITDEDALKAWVNSFDELYLGQYFWVDPDAREKITEMLFQPVWGMNQITYYDLYPDFDSWDFEVPQDSELYGPATVVFGKQDVRVKYYEKDGKKYVVEILDGTTDTASTGDVDVPSDVDTEYYSVDVTDGELLEGFKPWQDIKANVSNSDDFGNAKMAFESEKYKNRLWYIERDGKYYMFDAERPMRTAYEITGDGMAEPYTIVLTEDTSAYGLGGQTAAYCVSKGLVYECSDGDNNTVRNISAEEIASMSQELTGESDLNNIIFTDLVGWVTEGN